MSGDTWNDDTCHVTHGMRTCVIVTHVGHMACNTFHVSDTWQAMCQVHANG